ncbi:MAG: hypothetical protein U0T36_13230 [Saprospiraceae bacterium]|jgi:hypothetical protein
MASISGNKDRNVIPNWRKFEITANLGELNGSLNSKLNSSFKPDIADLLEDWEEEKSIGIAGDILGAAIICNQTKNDKVQEIAKFIEKNQHISSLALLDSAKFVVEQAKIHKDNYVKENSLHHEFSLQNLYNQIAYQKNILKKNQRNAIAWVELSRLYSIQGLDSKAERSMKNALYIAPENRFVLRSMSRLFSHLGDVEFADNFLKKADITEYDPWVMATSIALSDMRGKNSKFAKSGLLKINSSNLHPFSTSELSSALATLEMRNGKIKNSKKLFNGSLKNPNDNSLAQAEWASQRELRLDNVNPHKFNLSNSFEALARDSKEKGEWENSIKYSKDWFLDMPYSKGAVLFGYDIALHKLKDTIQASEIGKLGLISHSNDHSLINNIMYALSLSNNTNEAEILYNKIKNSKLDRLNTTNICLTATKGLLNYRKGNIEEGRRLYIEAMDLAKKLDNDELTNLALVNFAREEILATKLYDTELLGKLKQLKNRSKDENVLEIIDQVLNLNPFES